MNTENNARYIVETLNLSSLEQTREFPLYVQIETTARCNSSCRMCPRSKELPQRETWNMRPALREKLLAELAGRAKHIRRVIPQGYGEPLLDPEIHSFIARLKEIGIREVFISTNGAALTENVAAKLLDSGIDQVDFSVDAVSAETYEDIRRGLKFKTVNDNINRFIKMRDERNAKTKIRLRYVIMADNEHEYEPFLEYWRARVRPSDAVYGKKVHTFGGHINMPDSKEYLALRQQLAAQPCKGIFGTMVVLSDGAVPVCGVDVNVSHLAGNAVDSSLEDIWQGEMFTRFRKRHLEHGRSGFAHCVDCNTWAPELKLPEQEGHLG